ncbi:glycosyltransferase family 2 protein [Vibrio sp. TBV020]|uniref:glycosyltransferase family 2 protein n=1 Tax=Vibrio sp. TBV020 TaxID=3137398 RepID=UPI0038CD75C5
MIPTLLTIVIPYHNNENGIRRLLDSINVSDNTGVEVIVVNDNSESIEELLLEYPTIDLRYMELSVSQRWAGAARNKGLSGAKGRYVLFADDDDYLLPGWYEVLSNYLDKDIDIVFFAPMSTNEHAEPAYRHLPYQYLVVSHGDDPMRIRYRFHVPWSKLYRRGYLQKKQLKFDEIHVSNDVMFSLYASHFARKICVDRRSFYCVVDRMDSLTKKTSEEALDTRFETALRFNHFIEQQGGQYKLALIPHIYRAFMFSFEKGWERLLCCLKMRQKIFFSLNELYYLTKRSLMSK